MSLSFNLEKVVKKFLALTDSSELWAEALRAITLHMLSAYSRKTFQQFNLSIVLTDTLEKIKETKIDLSPNLSPLEGMSLIDVWYVLREQGIISPAPNKEAFKKYLESLLAKQGEIKYAWLLGEMAYLLGLDVRVDYLKRDYKFFKDTLSDIDYIYWLTHKVLLGTKYLQSPIPSFGFASVTTELLDVVKWVVKEGSLDLAAEVAICLDLCKKTDTLEYKSLIRMVVDNIREDGSLVDPLLEDSPYSIAHTTAAAMVALSVLPHK